MTPQNRTKPLIPNKVEGISGYELHTKLRDLALLRPHPGNARTHSKTQIRRIARSIETFGWTNPVLIDANGQIIAGHGRVEAARLLGYDEVPTITLEHLTAEQIRAYVIADNRLAELAGWDEETLAIELQFLVETDIDFDVGVIGFDDAEIDILIDGITPVPEDDPLDALPDPPPADTVVTKVGDLWLLGPHRLTCDDARDERAFRRLLMSSVAQMVFIDPPYNVPIDGNVSGLGAVSHREFVMAAGEMTEDEFIAFLIATLGHHAQFSADGAIHFVCIDWRHFYELLTATRSVYDEFKNLCVWNKDNGGMGSFYRSKHELIAVFKKGTGPHVNNVQLGRYGRSRTNVWDYPGLNSLHAGRDDLLRLHPTVKPVALVADAIRDCSRRGDLVLDGFAGSGTTIIAAEQTGRHARALELDPAYVDVAIQRWEALTGEPARHAETGASFTEMASLRTPESKETT